MQVYLKNGGFWCLGWRALGHLEYWSVPFHARSGRTLAGSSLAVEPPHGGDKSSQQRKRDSSRDFGRKNGRLCFDAEVFIKGTLCKNYSHLVVQLCIAFKLIVLACSKTTVGSMCQEAVSWHPILPHRVIRVMMRFVISNKFQTALNHYCKLMMYE